ncbi:MAG: hypothetical protein HFI72_06255 [Peptococcaceae bacterium]|nr:hypothetical protein [Peptococcaceae bacterium]
MSEKRFIVKEKQSLDGGKMMVLVDKETGVHYLSFINGFGPSLTPLLNENGQVMIEK